MHALEIKRHDISHDLPVMILLHGYGAGSCIFYRNMKDLSAHFHLFIVDLLGMGSSGWPPFLIDYSVDSAEDFFISGLRQWKTKVWADKGWDAELKKHILAGHSLGGYLASVYAMLYEAEIEHLVLLSPVGVPEKPMDFRFENIAGKYNTVAKRMASRAILRLWDRSLTPF